MRSKFFISVFLFLVALNISSAFLISDQGTDVREIATGNLTALANLTISIYDDSTGGNLIFEEAFEGGIANGSWNLMIDPDLEYGKKYWKDYKINEEDLDFDGNERLEFQSAGGKINNISLVNFSLINSCPEGSSIRLIYENGSVVCEADDSGSGTPDLTNYALKNQSETFVGDIATSQTGFFGWLGSLILRVNKLFVQDIDFNGTINGEGNITTTGNVTALYFIGNGSLLTDVSGTSYDDSWINSTFYNTTQVDDINASMKNYVDSQDNVINASNNNYVLTNNNSIVNWANSVFTSVSDIVNKVGNWSADKANYYTKTETDNINTSMKNYVDYVNSTNTGTSYDDTWINSTFYNTTQVEDINASMKNYVDYVNSTNTGTSYDDTWINQTLIPYTGANQNVNLGSSNLTTSGDLNITNDGTSAFYVNSTSGDVNVGGNVTALGILRGDYFVFTGYGDMLGQAATSNIIYIKNNVVGNGGLGISSYNSQPITFFTGAATFSSEKVRITSNGNVGIGTASPSQKLDVNGSINIADDSSYMQGGQTILRVANGTESSYFNTYVGVGAGNVTSSRQTAIGYYAGYVNTGIYQTAIGSQAGYTNTGSVQTAIGVNAGYQNTGISQSAVGYNAGRQNNGTYQTAIGHNAGFQNTGSYQSVIGYQAGYKNIGNYSIGIGSNSIRENIGNNVVAIGYQAGAYNNNSNLFILKQNNINAIPLILGNFLSGNVGIGLLEVSDIQATLHVNGSILANGTINSTVDVCIQDGTCLSSVGIYNDSWINQTLIPYNGASNNLNTSYNITTSNHLIISNGTSTASHWNMYEDGNGTLVWEQL